MSARIAAEADELVVPTPLPPEEQTSSSPVTSTTRPIGHPEGPDPGDVVAVLHLDHAVVQPAGLEVLDRHGPGVPGGRGLGAASVVPDAEA
jgi:hypothetical protein